MTLSRKQRWTVIGAMLLALLALAALVWFLPARPGVEVPTADSSTRYRTPRTGDPRPGGSH